MSSDHKDDANVSIMQGQFRSVVFTINNYTEDDVTSLKEMNGVSYLCFGKEVGASGTPHLQGYMEFTSPKKASTLQKRFRKRMHFEARRGSPKQCVEYCKKGSQSKDEWKSLGVKGPNYGVEADVYEHGELSHQGRRDDLTPVYDAIMAGSPINQVAIDFPNQWIKYHKGFLDFYNRTKTHRAICPIVYWFYGEAGAGKTSAAVQRFVGDYFIKNSESVWWDGYTQQTCIIIDDFDFNEKIGFRNLLRIMDSFQYQVEVKGSTVALNSKYLIFTSDSHPQDYFPHDKKWAQVSRRIFRIHEMKKGEVFRWAHPLVEQKYLDEKSLQIPPVLFEDAPVSLSGSDSIPSSSVQVAQEEAISARVSPDRSSSTSTTIGDTIIRSDSRHTGIARASSVVHVSDSDEVTVIDSDDVTPPRRPRKRQHVSKPLHVPRSKLSLFRASKFADVEAGCSDGSADEAEDDDSEGSLADFICDDSA